jgi:hypothetical protein
MNYTTDHVNKHIQAPHAEESAVLCVHWATGDDEKVFRNDARRMEELFRRLNYQQIKILELRAEDSGDQLEKEIQAQLSAFRSHQAQFILYYSGHGEQGGKGRWVS